MAGRVESEAAADHVRCADQIIEKIDGVEIVGFEEKPIARSHINAGVYVLNPEALDVLAASAADPKRTAEVLGCTPSQLMRLLRVDSRALVLVNQWRSDRLLHALR